MKKISDEENKARIVQAYLLEADKLRSKCDSLDDGEEKEALLQDLLSMYMKIAKLCVDNVSHAGLKAAMKRHFEEFTGEEKPNISKEILH
jgi:hypothetical protein